jgi:cell division control protein 6
MSKNINVLIKDELEKYSRKSTVILNKAIFDSEYLPDEILHRQNQILEMTKFFSGIFSRNDRKRFFRQFIILIGPPGSGKSATSKRFGNDFQEIAQRKIVDFNVKYFHLNCRRSRTVYLLLINLLRNLKPNFPKRGLSVSELVREMLDIIEIRNLYLIVALDEIEFLTKDSEINNLLYTFTRLNDESGTANKQRISVIVIARSKNFLYSLDPSTKSSLSKNIISFDPYNKGELKDILIKKIELGLQRNTVESNSMDAIVDYIFQNGKDIRIGLELLEISCFIIENTNGIKITNEIVNKAIKRIYPLNKEVIRDLPLPQKVTLLSIGKVFKDKLGSEKVTLSMVKKQYHIECNKHKLSIGQGHTSFWSYIQKLRELDLIKARVVNYGTKGRSTEIELDIPPVLVVRELEKIITGELEINKK